MKLHPTTFLLASICLALAIPNYADDTATVNVKILESGAMPKLGGYRPQQLKLSDEKPAELKKTPDLAAPLYGSIHFGDASYLIILDEPDGKDATLYVDANGNGDLTDDAATTWTKKEIPMRD